MAARNFSAGRTQLLKYGRQRCFALLLPFAVLFLQPAGAKSDQGQRTFRVGVLQSLTGIASEYGTGLTQILQLAAEDINRKSETKVNLVVEDDQTDPKKAVSVFQHMAAEGIDAVIGSSWDFPTNALIPLAARYKTVLFNVSVMPEALDLSRGEGYAFANAQTVAEEAAPLKDFLKLHPARKAAIIYANNRWGEAILGSHRRVLAAAGVQILDELKPTGFDANEWSGFIPRIRAKKPDLVLLLLNKNDIDVFLHRAHEQRLSALFYTTNNSFDALKQTSDKTLYDGVCFSYPYERLARMHMISERYKARFHEEPRWYADNAYDALWLLHSAFVASKERKVPLRDALEKTEYSGLAGDYRFRGTESFSVGGLSLACLKDGALRSAQLPPAALKQR